MRPAWLKQQETGEISAWREVSSDLWWVAVAGLMAVFYLATSLYISFHRLLWADEILTALNTRLPGWTTIWKAAAHGGDGLPPTYFMVVRTFDALFNHADFALRLPSALALTAGLLLTFDCARRLTDGLHGLIALSILTCSFLPYYGHEARSYALYFMFAALALWVWTHDNKNILSAVLFGVVIFLTVTMHYYAVLCLVPYAVWEAWIWKPGRLPSANIVAGLLGALCAIAILWVPIQAGRRMYPPNYWARPSLDALRSIFPGLFPEGLFLLALVVVWIALTGAKDKTISLPVMSSSERIGWLFFLIPVAGYLLAEMTHIFGLRYLIGTLPGIALASSCLLWRHFRGARRVSVGVFLLLATWGMAKQVSAVRDPNHFYYSPIRQILSSESSLRNDGKQFFVVGSQARYLEALHYSSHPEQYALLSSLDTGNLQETMTLAQYYPMQFWTLEDLRKHAAEAVLLAPLPSHLQTLKQSGFAVEIQASRPLEVVYVK